MNYLHKLFFFSTQKDGPKRELYIASGSINYVTWFKKDLAEGSTIFTSFPGTINHVVDQLPELMNQLAFDGLMFKTTAQYLADGGDMKKFTAWINPDNIYSMYSVLPNTTEVFFKSGHRIILTNGTADLMKNLLEHNKKQKERKAQKYGKQ